MPTRAATLLLTSICLTACDITLGGSSSESGLDLVDGAVCKRSDDCNSGNCLNNLCSGSDCTCSGADCPTSGASSSDCETGWLCVHHPGSSGFFTSSSTIPRAAPASSASP
jgi:hypothetical protein